MFIKLKLMTILAVFVGFSFNTTGNHADAQQLIASNAKEKKILSVVAALPEVQKRAGEIKRLSKGKTQITLMVSAPPDLYIPFYQVNVNDNAPTYKDYYQFAVDPKHTRYTFMTLQPTANIA